MIGFYINIPSHDYSTSRISRYVYKQVVDTRAGYNEGYRDSKIEIHTRIRQNARHVFGDRVEVEFRIEGISLFSEGYYLGEVREVPRRLGTMNVTVYNDGYVEFDRMVHLIGDPEVGFEVISSRYYGGHLLNEYRDGHDLRVGELDLYRERVEDVPYSRLFDPVNPAGLVPISLMPDDEYWGFQYMAGGHFRSSDYYSGAYDYLDAYDAYDDEGFYRDRSTYYGTDYSHDAVDRYQEEGPAAPLFRAVSQERFSHEEPAAAVKPFSNEGLIEYQTSLGQEVRMQRTVEIEYVKE